MQVHAVGDHLAGDLVPVEQRASRAGLAVMQRPHAVEQVGRVGHAGVDGGRGDVRGGVGVAGGSGHADPRRRLDQGGRPGEFGGDGNDAQLTRGGRVQALEGGHVGSEHVPRILGTAPDRREKRPLQVNPGDDALAGQAGQHRGPGLEVGERRGDQAGHDGRAAVPAVELRGAPGVVGCPLGKRRATASMHVQVDESRQDPVAAQVGDGKLEWQLFGRVAGPDRVDQRCRPGGSSRG